MLMVVPVDLQAIITTMLSDQPSLRRLPDQAVKRGRRRAGRCLRRINAIEIASIKNTPPPISDQRISMAGASYCCGLFAEDSSPSRSRWSECFCSTAGLVRSVPPAESEY
jgi:hypothetical protein